MIRDDNKKYVGFIGCGNMGSALASAVIKKENVKLFISDAVEEKSRLFAKAIGCVSCDNGFIAKNCDYIFLAVKPNILPKVLAPLKSTFQKRLEDSEHFTIVSMAAGVSADKIVREMLNIHYYEGGSPKVKESFDLLDDLEDNSKSKPKYAYFESVIRIMPNTPAAAGKGVILRCKNENVAEESVKDVDDILSEAGFISEIPEGLVDAASALSGCGPAYVYMFIEALADGAVQCGLPRNRALLYAAKTVEGAAHYLIDAEEHPGALKDEVCSPGGSTIEGVHALEEGAFRADVSNAVIRAYEKTKKLGR